MREYKDPRVLIRFEPSVPGISRAHINVVNSRHVFCELTARNIQRALALPEDGEIVQVEMILRRVEDDDNERGD